MTALIAFDFDGVIVDSLQAHLNAYARNFERFGRRFPIQTRRGWRQHYDSYWENNYLNNGFSKAELPQVLEHYDQYLSYKEVELFDGVDTVIKELSREFKLVVVSTTSKELIAKRLKQFGLGRYFSEIVGGEGKSDKSGILRRAISLTKVKPSQTIMIGDSPSDIHAGKKVGTGTIGVTYGWISASRIACTGPDRLVHKPEQILKAVERLTTVAL